MNQGDIITSKPVKQLIVLALELLLALPVGLFLARFNDGGIAWVFGGIASGAVIIQVYRFFYHYSPKPHRAARKTGLALVGLVMGLSKTSKIKL